MFRAAWKSLLSRKTRLLLSGIAVILGVAFISGTLILNASLGESIRSMFSTAYEDIDTQVSAPEPEGNEPAEPLPASLVEDIAAHSDVEDVTANVTSPNVQVLDKNDKVLPPTGAPTLTHNWTGEVGPTELWEGDGPQDGDQIAINAALADTTGYEVGDEMALITPADPEPQEFTIAGIFGFSGDRGTLMGENSIALTTPAAQQLLLNGEDGFTEIDVVGAGGISQQELADEVESTVGGDYQVKTGETLVEESSGIFAAVLDFFNYLLLGFGAIALLVSIFLIINTFSIIVAQRTRELALFRAIGASRGQVTRSVLFEAFVIGSISAIIGMLLGVGLGAAGTSAAAGMFGSMDTTLAIPPEAYLAALGIGVGVTVLAALLPARRAGKIAPIAALREAAATERPVRWFAIIGGLLLLVGGGTLTAALTGRFGDSTSTETLLGVFAAVVTLFLGATIFTPAITRPLVSVIGLVFSWTLPGKLGRRNSARNPRRTAVTATALMIGITLVTAVGVLFSSASASMQKYLDEQIKADLMIGATASTGEEPATFDSQILRDTADLNDVTSVSAIYMDARSMVDGEPQFVNGVDDMEVLSDLLAMESVAGTTDTLGAGDVVMSENHADEAGYDVGDTVEIAFADSQRPHEFTVSGILDPGDMGVGGVIVSADYATHFSSDQPLQAMLKVDENGDVGAVSDEVSDLLADDPVATVMDMSVMNEQITQMFDIMLMVVQVLLGLAMLIAVIGVVNTLTLSIRERTSELGLLRATGLTRGQVTRMVTVESIVIALFGALLGLGVGAGIGIAVQQALKDNFVDVLAMPWTTMAFYLIAAIVVGFLAALIPAYRANRLDVLAAISHE